MIANLAFGLCICSLVVISILIGMSVLLDVLLCAGGEVAELLLMPFFTIAVGFLFLGWPMVYWHGGTVIGVVLMTITVVTDIVAMLELILWVTDSVAGTRSRSASSGKAYVQVGSRGNASADTRSDSCRDHAPAPAGASKADGRSSPVRGCEGTHACPDASAGASSGSREPRHRNPSIPQPEPSRRERRHERSVVPRWRGWFRCPGR